MGTAGEIAANIAREYGIERAAINHIEDELKEYALACLQKAADKAKIKKVFSDDGISWKDEVEKASITNPDNLI